MNKNQWTCSKVDNMYEEIKLQTLFKVWRKHVCEKKETVLQTKVSKYERMYE